MPTINLASYVDDVDDLTPSRKRLKIKPVDYDVFKPGSIVKIRLENFVTYNYTEFNLSPSLNMIIGPNGSGKSTYVCAVCLGLAGKPEYIGRSKQVEDFIKNGQDTSKIEIVLKDDPNIDIEFLGSSFHRIRNNGNYKGLLTITRNLEKRTKIGRNLEKRRTQEYSINGLPTTESNVRNLVSKFHIQLDNLCQFLSQERVEEFAKLRPEKLLDETIRAIDSELLSMFEVLKKLQLQEIEMSNEIQTNTDSLKKLKTDEENFQQEVQLLNEYQETLDTLDKHKKLLPYLKIQDHREKLLTYKRQVEGAKKQLQEFQKEREPYMQVLASLNESDAQLTIEKENIEEKKVSTKRKLEKTVSKLNALREEIEKKNLQIEYYKGRSNKLKTKIETKKEDIDNIKRKISDIETPEESEVTELERKRNDLIERESQVNSEIDEVDTQMSTQNHNLAILERKMVDKKSSLTSTDNIHLLDQLNDRDLKRAVLFLRKNNEARKVVLEPPVLTVSVTHKDFAPYLAQCIDYNTSKAFTLINEQAYNTYGKEILKHFTANTRQLTGRTNSPPVSRERLRQLGFEGYLSDFVKGDSNVIKMLCEFQGIDQIPVSRKKFSAEQLEALIKPQSNNQPLFRKFIHGTNMLNVRYSNMTKQMYSVEIVVKPTNLYQGYVLSSDEKQRINNEMNDLKKQIDGIKNTMNQSAGKKAQLKMQLNEISTAMNDINKKSRYISNLKRQRSQYEEQLRFEKEKLEEYKKDIRKDTAPKIQQIEKLIGESLKSEIDCTIELENIGRSLRHIQIKNLQADIAIFEHNNKKTVVKSFLQSFEEKKNELRAKYDELKNKYKELRDTEEYRQWRRDIDAYNQETKQVLNDLAEKYRDEDKFNLIYVEQIVNKLESKIQLSNHDRSAVALLEQTKAKIADLEDKLPTQVRKCNTIRKEMSDKQKVLEPRLESIVSGIGRKFSELFKDVGTAGGVTLNRKSKLFNDWKLEIMVQFRDEGKLSGLDSHTQSGGERAVSTVLYMIALQKFTQAPFRVVDEINQGMDTNFERLVHKAMVQNACEEGTSQYFLITPKLLTGLNYHEKMRIHCVMAGSHIPNPSEDIHMAHLGEVSNYDI